MSYNDPYTSYRAAGSSSQYTSAHPQQPYDSNAYPPYEDPVANEYYNPYSSNNPRSYPNNQPDYSYGENQEAGYNGYPPPQPQNTMRSKKPSVSIIAAQKEASGFENGEFTPNVQKNRSPSALRAYRYDHQGNLWTKGGRGRCAGRVCCCTLMTTVFLIVSIVLALALWVRPPSITIGDVQTMTVDGNTIQQTSTGLSVNLGVSISVRNPNYFSVDFKNIEANITYPINNLPIGSGDASNILFKSRTETNFTFPFALVYNSTADTGSKVILDIAEKCGVTAGSTKQNIVVNYKITLGIRILVVTISPVISNQFSFACPLSASDIEKFISGSS
ncbi:hypothetical protein HYPSUDRAFT_931062 [Hypholoma sublateritium FD-334 SS-4]|uniref:Late embryogenesis abundant protein LEA-2 subgroup domain-containing protein n=1 Tax=Hypholoma sublateritium (strain FD-334 SS-4) TaxID=945553 RepID=A0A0D2MTP0_HYPSF|nr:hypothetical protein HYPSUDRAFT_931062 [Hypholoma sublateritium FD-334 SS-4]